MLPLAPVRLRHGEVGTSRAGLLQARADALEVATSVGQLVGLPTQQCPAQQLDRQKRSIGRDN